MILLFPSSFDLDPCETKEIDGEREKEQLKSVLAVFMEISFKDESCIAILKNTIVLFRCISIL